MCKAIGKSVTQWLKLDSTESFLKAYLKAEQPLNPLFNRGASGTPDRIDINKVKEILIVKTVNNLGGAGSTYANKDIALELARWVSPEFAIWANKQIKTLFEKGSVLLKVKPSYQIDDDVERAKAWIIETEERRALQLQAEEDKPKVEFYDTVSDAKGTHTMAEVAKLVGIGRNKLFTLLRDKKWLRHNNEPYQDYMDRNYFITTAKTFSMNGSNFTGTTTRVTPRGLQAIEKLLKEENNQLM